MSTPREIKRLDTGILVATLTPDETARALAYILQMNKFEPGKKELPTDPDGLAAIQIARP